MSNFSQQQVCHLSTLPLFNSKLEDAYSAGLPRNEQTPILPQHTNNLHQ